MNGTATRSTALASQDELVAYIDRNILDLNTLRSRIDEYTSHHPETSSDMLALNTIANGEDPSLPCDIDPSLFKEKFVKRTNNLYDLMSSIPESAHPVTESMIHNVGLTIANRVYEVCSGKEGFRGVKANYHLLTILRNVFLHIYIAHHRDLIPQFVNVIVDLCKNEKVFIVVDHSMYNSVRKVKHMRLPDLDKSNFPALDEAQ